MVTTPTSDLPVGTTPDRNRTVHLARRDAFVECAVELLNRPLHVLESGQQQVLVTQVVEALRAARRHAFFAGTHAEASSREQDFLRFLDLKIETVRSARTMIDHQILLQEEEGFLCSFLQTGPEEFHLPALHFQRRAEDILHGLWHMLSLAQAPFHELRTEVREGLDQSRRDRYDRAYQAARAEAEKRFALTPPD